MTSLKHTASVQKAFAKPMFGPRQMGHFTGTRSTGGSVSRPPINKEDFGDDNDLEGTPYLPSDEVVSTAPVQTHLDLPAHLDQRYCGEMDVYFTDPRDHLEAHAAAEPVTTCKVLGVSYAKYMGTFDADGNAAARPSEDTALRGWTAQQRP